MSIRKCLGQQTTTSPTNFRLQIRRSGSQLSIINRGSVFLGCMYSLNCLMICVARSITVNHKIYIYIYKINASSIHQFLSLSLNLSVYNYNMEIILSTSQYYSEDNIEKSTLEPIYSRVSPVLSAAFPFVKLQ